MNQKKPFIWVTYFFMFSLVHIALKAQEPIMLDSKMKLGISNDMRIEELKVRWKKSALENCAGIPCVPRCGDLTIRDVDGNSYNTVQIGTQCWTKTNLKVTKYNDNTPIPLNNTYTSGTVSTVWQGLPTGAYTIYGNEASSGTNATNYGFLYNWYAVKGIITAGGTSTKNICPTGFHVPTDSDWSKLVIFIDSGADTSSASLTQSTTAGTKLKKNDALLWTSNTGTDDYGFSVLPGGWRFSDGSFNSISYFAFFWSATEDDSNSSLAWFRDLNNYSGNVNRYFNFKSVGASVRCLRD